LKKPSNTWKLLEAQHQFFLDRNQGNKIMPELLRNAGLPIVCHSDEFTDDMTPDPVWIEHCSNKDWVILTGDKAIETDPINRQAVVDFKAKVFLLEENNSRAVEWASAIIVGRHRLVAVAHENEGPFFASVRKNSNGMIFKMRRP
jgi:hypothetical protein